LSVRAKESGGKKNEPVTRDTVCVAAPNLPHQDLANKGPEDDHPKDNLGISGAIIWEDKWLAHMDDVKQSDAEANIVNHLVRKLLIQLVGERISFLQGKVQGRDPHVVCNPREYEHFL